MKTKRAIPLAAGLLYMVLPLSCAVHHSAQKKPPRHDAENPKTGGPIAPEMLHRLAWGSPAPNGLRAAVYFDPTKEAYMDGEVVKRRSVFHNSGANPLLFTVRLGGLTDGWTVVDEQGQAVPVERVTYALPVPLMAFRLEVGYAVELDCLSTALGASARVDYPADTAIRAEAGTTCRARWTLEVTDTTYQVKGKPVAVPDVWHGLLTTGEVRFRIGE